MKLYRNKKNGRLYRFLHYAVDCTNARDGNPVVVYCPDDRPDFICTRDRDEFEVKFDPAPEAESDSAANTSR